MEKPKIDKGVFSFLAHRGLNIHQMRSVLSLYAKSKDIIRPKKARFEWYSDISIQAQTDFKEFKKAYNLYKVKYNFTKVETYEEWYDRCSLDGSFAYNEVTDNF